MYWGWHDVFWASQIYLGNFPRRYWEWSYVLQGDVGNNEHKSEDQNCYQIYFPRKSYKSVIYIFWIYFKIAPYLTSPVYNPILVGSICGQSSWVPDVTVYFKKWVDPWLVFVASPQCSLQQSPKDDSMWIMWSSLNFPNQEFQEIWSDLMTLWLQLNSLCFVFDPGAVEYPQANLAIKNLIWSKLESKTGYLIPDAAKIAACHLRPGSSS